MTRALLRALWDLFGGWILLGFVLYTLIRWPVVAATLLMALGMGLVATFCWHVARSWGRGE